MSSSPRIALGTVQANVDLSPLSCALLDTFELYQWHAQSFLAAAQLAPCHPARCITGQSQRHLDSWLMSRATSREIFAHGARASDISLVEGQFQAGLGLGQKSNLDSLCDWLDLPAIMAIDVRQLATCVLPRAPRQPSGILLDGVRDAADACRWQTSLEALYGAPVLGYLTAAGSERVTVRNRDGLPISREMVQTVGNELRTTLRLDRLLGIAKATPLPAPTARLFAKHDGDDTISVAVAFDEAFGSYFADTLDLLEARGAHVCDFSPLRSEALPWGTDVVYIAGGPSERYAEELSSNHCLKQSLRNFVAQGGRIYAEGSGLAYLCERMIDRNGAQHAMVGLLPGIAQSRVACVPPQPVEITFNQDTWLGARGTIVRGYQNNAWQILPEPDLVSFASEMPRRWDMVGTQRVIGCGLQVDFAAQPHLVSSFFRPRSGVLVGSY